MKYFSSLIPKDYSWIEILREGEWDYNGSKVTVTADTIANMIKNFSSNVRGTFFDENKTIPTLDIDFEHKRDKKYGHDAAGWFGQLESRVIDGVTTLWMKPIQWTETGLTAIKDGIKKYFSVEFDDWTNPETGITYKDVLFGGALTNRPYVKNLSPVKLAEETPNIVKKEKTMKKLLAELSAAGVSMSSDATDEFIEEKAISHIKYLSEKLSAESESKTKLGEENIQLLTELEEATTKLSEIEEKESKTLLSEIEKEASKKLTPAERKDEKGIYRSMLNKKQFSEVKYMLSKMPVLLKEDCTSHDEPDGDEEEIEFKEFDKMDHKDKTKAVKAFMEKKNIKSFADAAAQLKKEHNAKFMARKGAK